MDSGAIDEKMAKLDGGLAALTRDIATRLAAGQGFASQTELLDWAKARPETRDFSARMVENADEA
ncbi:MAG: hypothetical protein IBJ15_08900, partial [Alphaproteobacteria bacterium]|nr:hypothetical protein [Alphaproteobacteria bacterium]